VPAFATVPDSGLPGATGRMRYDLRAAAQAGRPLLVLIGGMTQTLASWGGQMQPLSRTRPVLAYEARGQGETELALDDVSLPRQADDLAALLNALERYEPVDVCGFSFGGRVALAFADRYPARVRRLVVSGVGIDRGILGRLIVQGWIATLATGDLEALARVSLPDIVGPAYLEKYAGLVEPMVKAVVQRNSYAGIVALFRQTLGKHDLEWSAGAVAERLRVPALVMGGALDRLAPPAEVEALARLLNARHRVFPDAGHTIPIEAREAWHDAVVDFLDAEVP
jgi:3-oxoadipate enol-lactonase